MSIIGQDDFNRTAGISIGNGNTNWNDQVIHSLAWLIQTGGFASPAGPPSDDAAAFWIASLAPNDGYVQCKLQATHADGTGKGWGLYWRGEVAAGAMTGYRLVANNSGHQFGYDVAGSFTQVDVGGPAYVAGDILRLQVVGTSWSILRNGATVVSGTDAHVASGTHAGLFYSSTASTVDGVDDFEFGDFIAPQFKIQPNRLRPRPFKPGIAR